jgi:hypothetical protein
MKRGTNIARTLVLATVICMMLSCTVFAAEGGSVWVSTGSSSTGEGTVANESDYVIFLTGNGSGAGHA